MQDLIARMNAVCDAQPFTTSWYVKDLVTGQEADRTGDMVLPSASTRKTSILMHALSRVHEGVLKLDEPCTIEARLQEGVDSGTYQYMTPGCVIPLRDAFVNMIITSDNVGNACRAQRQNILGRQAAAFAKGDTRPFEAVGEDRPFGAVERQGSEPQRRQAPRRTWVISATIEIAISAGDKAPIAKPTGPRMRLRAASSKPLAASRSRRAACVFREPRAPT